MPASQTMPYTRTILLLLAALLPSSLAMTCDSNTQASKCNSAVDGNVKCVWDETKGTCGSGDERTETGTVGITSIEVDNPNPMDDMPIPTLTPEEVQKAVDTLSLNSTFCTLPPDNTTRTGPCRPRTRARSGPLLLTLYRTDTHTHCRYRLRCVFRNVDVQCNER